MNALGKLRLYQKTLRKNLHNNFRFLLTLKKIEKLKLTTYDLRKSDVRDELVTIRKMNRELSEAISRLLWKWAWEAIHTYGLHIPDDGYSSGDSLGYDSDSEVSTDSENNY